MRKLTLSIWFFCAILLGSLNANAQCDCIGGKPENDYRGNLRYPTAYAEYKSSSAVFVGEFIDEKKIEIPPLYKNYPFPYEYEVKFRVETAWKKNLEEFITVRMDASCVIGFKKGERYLVYAFGAKHHLLRINYCSRTRLFTKAPEDLKEFADKGEKPRKILTKARS